MKNLIVVLWVLMLSGCANFSTQKADILIVSKPYLQIIALLNHQLARCVTRNPTFFRMGVLVKSHTYGNDTLIRVLRSDSPIIETDLPMIALLNVSKEGKRTTVSVRETHLFLGSNFHLNDSVSRWLQGDMRCKAVNKGSTRKSRG